MSDYLADVKKYAPNANTAAVDAIVKYCGIALHSTDAAMVRTSDAKELATVRDGLAAKKLGLTADAADKAIKAAAEKMKGVNRKGRVTLCYLVAEASGTLGKLA